jgi:hypothetical protein
MSSCSAGSKAFGSNHECLQSHKEPSPVSREGSCVSAVIALGQTIKQPASA